MEKTLALREANQGFTRYIREVEAGAAFTITRNGAPVARLVPIEREARQLTPEQRAARERTRARTSQGWLIEAEPFDRDVLHER